MFYTPVPPFDASKTLWKPDFLASKGLVERPHPPLRRGDYMDRLGIYGWQNLPADFVPDSASSEKRQRAIEAMYYGLENEPPCSECLKRDRWCSRLLTEGDQSLACSNCYLYRLGPCSHSNGGRTNRPTAETRTQSGQKRSHEMITMVQEHQLVNKVRRTSYQDRHSDFEGSLGTPSSRSSSIEPLPAARAPRHDTAGQSQTTAPSAYSRINNAPVAVMTNNEREHQLAASRDSQRTTSISDDHSPVLQISFVGATLSWADDDTRKALMNLITNDAQFSSFVRSETSKTVQQVLPKRLVGKDDFRESWKDVLDENARLKDRILALESLKDEMLPDLESRLESLSDEILVLKHERPVLPRFAQGEFVLRADFESHRKDQFLTDSVKKSKMSDLQENISALRKEVLEPLKAHDKQIKVLQDIKRPKTEDHKRSDFGSRVEQLAEIRGDVAQVDTKIQSLEKDVRWLESKQRHFQERVINLEKRERKSVVELLD